MVKKRGKVEFYQDKKDEFRWRLRASNGEIIATGGEGYATRENCREGFRSVQRYALNPESEGDPRFENQELKVGRTFIDLFFEFTKLRYISLLIVPVFLVVAVWAYCAAQPGKNVSLFWGLVEFYKKHEVSEPGKAQRITSIEKDQKPTGSQGKSQERNAPISTQENSSLAKEVKQLEKSLPKTNVKEPGLQTLDAQECESLLRTGRSASKDDILKACILVMKGWQYIMPRPKSRQARWGNSDGRTTWYYGYWKNTKTGQYSKQTPGKNDNYQGDGQRYAGQWRRGGSPGRPTIIEYLCSKSGGPTY